jgi:hypothetical protein
MIIMMMSSLRKAERSKERKTESQMISRVGVFDVLFPMVLSLFGLADCRWSGEEVKLLMWGGIFD